MNSGGTVSKGRMLSKGGLLSSHGDMDFVVYLHDVQGW